MRLLILLALALLPVLGAQAQTKTTDHFVIDDFSIHPGETVDMPVGLVNNEHKCYSVEVHLKLPEGLSIVGTKSSGDCVEGTSYTVNTERTGETKFTITFINGVCTILSEPGSNWDPIPKGSGTLLTLKVKADETLNSGERHMTSVKILDNGVEVSLVDGTLEGDFPEFFYYTPPSVDVTIKEVNYVNLLDEATDAPSAEELADVTTNHTLLAGWNSVVLPFSATSEELGAEKVVKYDGTTETTNGYVANFTSVTTLEPNTPYLVKMAGDASAPMSFKEKKIDPTGNLTVSDHAYSLVGTYIYLGDESASPIAAGDYVVYEKGLRRTSQGGNKLKAFRAYMKKELGANNAKPLGITINNEETTGIEATEIESVMDGNTYNLSGMKIENPRHGVFIKNGKKVIIK